MREKGARGDGKELRARGGRILSPLDVICSEARRYMASFYESRAYEWLVPFGVV